MPSDSPGRELASLDFESLIGGPLVATVRAQGLAAVSTVDFIKSVGFDEDDNVVYVNFNYRKDDTTASLEVPLLSMVPIPYLRVEEMTLDFKAKITSVQERVVNEKIRRTFEGGGSASLGAISWLFRAPRLKMKVVSQKDTRERANVTRNYSMKIFVRAVQDEMPGGLEKILDILEESIKEEVRETEEG